MKLEDQVYSLDLAKRLKELGVRQESCFSWYQVPGGMWALGDQAEAMNNAVQVSNTSAWQVNDASAFTVAELGEMLPDDLNLNGVFGWYSFKEVGRWRCAYRYHMNSMQEAGTEADARAKMLIYLLENKLIDLSA